MLYIFVPDMFGIWGAGKEAGAIAPLLPSDSIFLYRLELCCKTISCFGIRDRSFLPIMRWTASQAPPLMTQHSHRHPVSHHSRCYDSRKLRSLLFPNHLLYCFELYSDCITLYLNTVLTLLSSCVFHFYYSAALAALNDSYFTSKFW